MTDIVERLELQAFVADKIQSGMKPLIMDCLAEITHLRCQYEALLNQAEMNARLLTENASLRGEVETLRRDIKTAVMGDSAELRDVKRENEKLRKALKPFAHNYQNNGLSHSTFMFAMKDLLAAKKALGDTDE